MNSPQSKQSLADSSYDVVVVGCGPTGATLANLLAIGGLSVLVIDRATGIYNLPRAVHFDDETMRVFQAVGIADALAKKARVNPGMRFVGEEGEVLLDWPRPDGISRAGWHSSYRLHQPDLEQLLRDRLQQHNECTIKLGVELLALTQTDTSVTVSFKNIATSLTNLCKAKVVVGCDGANSTVRGLIGLSDQDAMEDLGFNERWLVVDMLLNSDLPELGDHTVQYCSVDQPMTYCRNPGLRRRWEMAIPDELSDEQPLDADRIWSSLSRWIQPHQARIERKAIYTFRSQLAHLWRDRHVFIAGDAAHLTPPFMGQGMCAGIRDASNLAWKLVMHSRGHGDDSLLDSYQQERRPHVRQYITTAMRLGGLINSLDRRSALALATSDDQSDNRMASITPVLGSSFLVPDHTQSVGHVGLMLEQPLLLDGTLLDEMVGYRPVLISRETAPEKASGVFQLNRGSGLRGVYGAKQKNDVDPEEGIVLLVSDHPELQSLLDSLGVFAVLVRPDRYILATAANSNDAQGLNWFVSIGAH